MNLIQLSGVAAIALVAMTGTASAFNIKIDSATPFTSDTPATPFSLLPLGTSLGNPSNVQTTSPLSVGGVAIDFTGGGGSSPASGVYAGGVGGSFSSPFGQPNTTSNYLVAGGTSGVVKLDYSDLQAGLNLLWGTADTPSGYNNITLGGTVITGADIVAVALAQVSPASLAGC